MYKFMSFKGPLNIVLNGLIILVGIRVLFRTGIIPSGGWNASWSGGGYVNPILTQQADSNAGYQKYVSYSTQTPAIVRKSAGFFTTR